MNQAIVAALREVAEGDKAFVYIDSTGNPTIRSGLALTSNGGKKTNNTLKIIMTAKEADESLSPKDIAYFTSKIVNPDGWGYHGTAEHSHAWLVKHFENDAIMSRLLKGGFTVSDQLETTTIATLMTSFNNRAVTFLSSTSLSADTESLEYAILVDAAYQGETLPISSKKLGQIASGGWGEYWYYLRYEVPLEHPSWGTARQMCRADLLAKYGSQAVKDSIAAYILANATKISKSEAALRALPRQKMSWSGIVTESKRLIAQVVSIAGLSLSTPSEPDPLDGIIPWCDPTLQTCITANQCIDSANNSHESFSGLNATDWFPTPIVLDLDGDGVETTALATSTAHFDLDANGFAERTGWVSPDDGLLVRDLNGNGIIDDGTELFGSATHLPNGALALNGFAALAALDSNGDGRVDSSDSAFSELKIWRDLNGDGKTDAGELMALADVGVSALNVAAAPNGSTVASGAVDWLDGTYVKPDGATGIMSDMLFQRDTADTVATTTVDVPDEIATLPDIAGKGNVASLHQAMAQDSTGHLAELVASFSEEATWVAQREIAKQILLAWTGSENVPIGDATLVGAGQPDGRFIHALEVLFGEPVGVLVPANWRGYQSILESVVDDACVLLSAQTSMSGLLALVTQDAASGAWDYSIVTSLFASWMQEDDATCCDDLANFLRVAGKTGTLTQSVLDAMKAEVIGTSSRAWMTFANSEARLMSETDAQENRGYANVLAEGSNSGETLELSELMALMGGDGNDVIDGTASSKWISGGGGDDVVNGVRKFVFGVGDGHDTVTAKAGSPLAITFVGVASSDVSCTLDATGDGVVLALPSGDTVHVLGFFGLPDFTASFTDGTSLSKAQVSALAANMTGTDGDDVITARSSLASTINGGTGNDTITGSLFADTIDGGAGDDHLYGNSGGDIILGGAGGDVIDGGIGADTVTGGFGDDTITNAEVVIFRKGDGHDMVSPVSTAIVAIQMQDFLPAEVSVVQDTASSGIKLMCAATGDSVTLANAFGSDAFAVSFSDGTVWQSTDLVGMAATITGTVGDDTLTTRLDLAVSMSGGAGSDALTGGNLNDVLDGGDGNDTLSGGQGDDTLLGGAGDDVMGGGNGTNTARGGIGDDTITNVSAVFFRKGDGHDIVNMQTTAVTTLVLEDSLPADVVVSQVPGTDDAILTITATGDTVRLAGFLYRKDAAVSFSDGTSWSATDLLARAAIVSGTSGDDVLATRFDLASTMSGGAGNDTISGSDLNDSIDGGAGNDVLNGGAGADSITGGAGNDTINGGNGADIVSGGLGDDSISYAETVLFQKGDGHDTVNPQSNPTSVVFSDILPSEASVTFDAATNGLRLTVTSTGDSILVPGFFSYKNTSFTFSNGVVWTPATLVASSSVLIGTANNDTLTAQSSVASSLSGLGGNDTLIGGSLNDFLDGGDGNDSLSGGSGDDTIMGGAGIDTLGGGYGNDVIDGGAGNDIIDGSFGSDTVTGGLGDDTITGAETIIFRRGDGADTVSPQSAATTIQFPDSLQADVVVTLDAARTGIILSIPSTGDSIRVPGWFNYKNFTINFSDGSSWVTVDILARAAVMNGTAAGETMNTRSDLATTMYGLAGDDTLNGSSQSDTLYGGDGVDKLYGVSGNDALYGGAGNDSLYGGDGVDSLDGGDGNDTIDGGNGLDAVLGGIGNDTITNCETVLYRLGDGADIVTLPYASTPTYAIKLYGIAHADVVFTRVGIYDLKMTMPDAGSVIISGFYYNQSTRPATVTFFDTTDVATATQVASWTTADLLAAAAQGTGYGFAGSDTVITATLESGVGIVAEQLLASGDVGATTDAEESLAHVSMLATGDQATPGAGAVVLNGGRQADNDVTWCLADTSRDATGLFSSQMGTEMEVLVRAACEAWEQVCGVHFTQVADNGLADIRLGFGDFDSATTGVIGYANMKQNADGTFAKDSVLRIDDTADVSVVTNENGELVYQGMNASVQQVLEHEIGHALGMGSDADPNSVMCWKLTEQNRTLDATDVAGAQALYGAPTGVTTSALAAAQQLMQTLDQDASQPLDAYMGSAMQTGSGASPLASTDAAVATGVNQLIQAMATFDAPPTSAQTTCFEQGTTIVQPLLAVNQAA